MPLFPYAGRAVVFGAPPDRIDLAVASILAGESSFNAALDFGLTGDERRIAADRAKAARLKPKARLKRKVVHRWL